MPNWAYSDATVTGPKESLKKMLDYGKDHIRHFSDGDAITLGSWIPRPETYDKYDTTNYPNGEKLVIGEKYNDETITEELIERFKQATKEQREKYGAVGWYEWNCKNYGCKWDCPLCIVEKEDSIEFSIQSPWGIPDVWYKRMSEMYPDLVFTVKADFELDDQWYVLEWRNGVFTQLDTGYFEYVEADEAEIEKAEKTVREALNNTDDDGLPF